MLTQSQATNGAESPHARIRCLEAACSQAQAALESVQERARLLIDYAPEAIVILDAKTGRFIDANPRAEELFGLPRSDLLGLGPFDVSPAAQPGGTSLDLGCRVIEEAIRGGAPVFEWWHTNARGECFPCEVHLVKVPWGDREVVRGSIIPVGHRKHVELLERARGEVLAGVAQGDALEAILETLVRTTEELLPGVLCSVLLLDAERRCLKLGAAPSLPDFYNAALDGLPIGPDVGSCGAAAYCGQLVIVRDVREHPNWRPFRPLAEQAGLIACWSEPIISLTSAVIGAFAMYYRAPRDPGPIEIRVIRTAAQLAAMVIEHDGSQRAIRELNESLERRVAEQVQELTATNQRLVAAESLSRIAAVAFETQDSIVITDPQGAILRVNQGFTRLTGYSQDEVEGDSMRILKSGLHDAEFYRQMWAEITGQGYWHGEVWNRRKDGHVFPQRLTITCVKDPAGQITHYVGHGVDMTEAKRAEADRAAIQTAREMQQRLFPHAAPQVPVFELAGAVYLAERASGDYFDFLELGDKSIGALIADVSGHGLAAALVMAQTQAYLRAFAGECHDPGQLLTRVNRLFTRGESQHFVTIFLARLDVETRSLTYAAAGHCGYLLRGDGSELVLEANTIPLGIVPDLVVQASPQITLEPGDLVLLPTDGIVETENPAGAQFGAARTLELARAERHRAAAEIVQALYQAARDFADGAEQTDDISAVAVKVRED